MLLKLCKFFWLTIFLSTSCATSSTGPITDKSTELNQPVLAEKSRMEKSTNDSWWLNSGAYIYRSTQGMDTVQGKLAEHDTFRLLYAKSNPLDTDNGYQPQNILRLVTSAKFKNFTQQVFFKINRINTSASPNRNQSNGVLLLHRYQDGDNLYYVGIRVDGYAVVKKKLQGKYYTLKSAVVYPGSYNRDTRPNLLPINRRIGIRTVITDTAAGNVDIKMFVNDAQLGSDWTQVLQAEDTAAEHIKRIVDKGHAGIRSDFMDVSFDGYSAIEIVN